MNKNRGIWHAKRLDNGEWIEGYLVYNDLEAWIIPRDPMPYVTYVVDPETLGECTCLCDMNGKPIFEGDICAVVATNIADDEYGVIKYDDEAVFLIDFGTYTINFCDNVNSSSVEVIGNVHDNPELLPD